MSAAQQQRPSITFAPLQSSPGSPPLLQLAPTSTAAAAVAAATSNTANPTVTQPARRTPGTDQVAIPVAAGEPAAGDDAEKAAKLTLQMKGESSMQITSFLCVAGWIGFALCISMGLWTYIVLPLLFTLLVLARRLFIGFKIERYHNKREAMKCLIDWPRDLWEFMWRAGVLLFLFITCIFESIFKCLRYCCCC